MNLLAVTALFCTLGSAPVAHAQAADIASGVRACKAGDAAACNRLERRLETIFIASGDGADRTLARKLASAATKVLRDEGAPRIVAEPIARCSANDVDACNRIANILARLFTGSDAQLDRSRDRAFARAFASRLVSEVRR